MRIITTSIKYGSRTTDLALELAAAIDLEVTEEVEEEGTTVSTASYRDIALSDTEYWKYWSILDAPTNVREIS